MNRLQKKCVIATAGFHLLLLVILFVGPAFFAPKPKVDDSQTIDVIPANLIDAVLSSGVKDAAPPPPAPVVVPQPQQPAPIAPVPKPVEPPSTFVQKMEDIFKPKPVKPTPPVDQQHKIQPNLKQVVRNSSKNSPIKPQPNSRAAQNAAQNLRNKLSSATTVDMPGDSSAAYANYASVVKSIYEQAWVPPDDADNDDANIKVSVTIASDGTVITSSILTPSGDAGVDATVQRTLNRVTTIAPFPSGTTDKERTYIINFNLKAKRMLG